MIFFSVIGYIILGIFYVLTCGFFFHCFCWCCGKCNPNDDEDDDNKSSGNIKKDANNITKNDANVIKKKENVQNIDVNIDKYL